MGLYPQMDGLRPSPLIFYFYNHKKLNYKIIYNRYTNFLPRRLPTGFELYIGLNVIS